MSQLSTCIAWKPQGDSPPQFEMDSMSWWFWLLFANADGFMLVVIWDDSSIQPTAGGGIKFSRSREAGSRTAVTVGQMTSSVPKSPHGSYTYILFIRYVQT